MLACLLACLLYSLGIRCSLCVSCACGCAGDWSDRTWTPRSAEVGADFHAEDDGKFWMCSTTSWRTFSRSTCAWWPRSTPRPRKAPGARIPPPGPEEAGAAAGQERVGGVDEGVFHVRRRGQHHGAHVHHLRQVDAAHVHQRAPGRRALRGQQTVPGHRRHGAADHAELHVPARRLQRQQRRAPEPDRGHASSGQYLVADDDGPSSRRAAAQRRSARGALQGAGPPRGRIFWGASSRSRRRSSRKRRRRRRRRKRRPKRRLRG